MSPSSSLKIINPATEELVRELPMDSAADIRAKFEKAVVAQKSWQAVPLSERKDAIARFNELLGRKKDELARTLTLEMGKPIQQARNEIGATPARIQFFLDHVESVLGREKIHEEAGQLEEALSLEPLGVIGNISAWNYPYFVGSNVFVPALLTGNAVLYKPSEFAALTGLAIGEMLQEAGVPRDVFATIIGDGRTGGELLRQPLAGIFFTGSLATGRKIAEAASTRFMKVQLELGGKDPTYVCEDVDVQSAAEGLADGAFYNTGQSCCSVERIYVHEKIYSAFVEAFKRTVEGFVVGDPLDDKTYIGPLTRPAQIEVLERQIRDAVSKGARLLSGGKRLQKKGYYFAPTLLVDTNHSMEVMRDESFGPIIGIQKVKGDDEAVTLMNDTEYGLTAGIYARDRGRAETLMSRLEAGSVYWNCCDRVSPRLPWTGWKSSGIGSTLGVIGIEAFLRPKAWHLRLPSPRT